MSSLIETCGLSKHYGSVQALKDVDITLDTGEITGLVGKNGAGKTTLLALLSGALQPNSGTVSVLGRRPASNALLGKIGILLQEANFKRGVPVIRQLVQFAQLLGKDRRTAKEEVDSLLEQLGRTDYAGKKPETMSYGQRKRLAIIQAFLGSPQLVILDEPTAGLDPVVADEIRKFIRRYGTNTSLIISSHNLYEIGDICSRVVVLDKGKLVTNSKISDIVKSDTTLNFATDTAVSGNIIKELGELQGIYKVDVDTDDPTQIKCHYDVEDVNNLQLELQQVLARHGIGIMQMSRGKSAISEILGLVNQDSHVQ